MWTPESRLTTRATPDRCFVKPRKPGDKCPFWSVVIDLSITTCHFRWADRVPVHLGTETDR